MRTNFFPSLVAGTRLPSTSTWSRGTSPVGRNQRCKSTAVQCLPLGHCHVFVLAYLHPPPHLCGTFCQLHLAYISKDVSLHSHVSKGIVLPLGVHQGPELLGDFFGGVGIRGHGGGARSARQDGMGRLQALRPTWVEVSPQQAQGEGRSRL